MVDLCWFILWKKKIEKAKKLQQSPKWEGEQVMLFSLFYLCDFELAYAQYGYTIIAL